MTKKKGLLARMLLSIGLPVALIFMLVAGVSLYIVNQAITKITVSELSARSQAVSAEIENYFTTYLETATQMSTNPEIQNLFKQVTPGVRLTTPSREVKHLLHDL